MAASSTSAHAAQPAVAADLVLASARIEAAERPGRYPDKEYGRMDLIRDVTGSLLTGGGTLILPAIAWRYVASPQRRAIKFGIKAQVAIAGALFVAMWVLRAGGNTDYFKLAAPLLLVNVAVGAYYALTTGAAFVRTWTQRHAG